MSYGSIDSPNYRDTFTPPQQLSLSRPMVNMDAPNYRPHEPINSRPYERSFARKPQTISSQLVQTDVIFSGVQVNIPWNWQRNTAAMTFKYTWAPSCVITSLKISGTIGVATPSYDACWADVMVNGQKVAALVWNAQQGRILTVDTEVKPWIKNGENVIKIEVGKDYPYLADRTWDINLNLEATYTGTAPGITPPKPPFDPTMLLWGGALLGVGYVAYKYIGPRADMAAKKKGWY